ncbi:cytochrome P450 [Artomyces pyxidatus]|uniref:Cytochrome P450 n=1 Tax=Artomyces pyxidatus TaxID=48021 RepID=A0ACB8SFH4_9AGAM|nr:cytochrome P450 [Artomyces pyxidatus]
MMATMPSSAIVTGSSSNIYLVVIIGLVSVLVASYFRSPWRTVPPGPRGLPLLGNIRELADTKWLTSSAPMEEYGEIMYLRVPGQSVILLNSQRVAVDILDKRAKISSSRPRLILGSEIYTGGFDVALAYYGDVWRRLRRTAHEALTTAAVKRYNPIQAKEAAILALDMLADGNEWDTSLRRHSASLIMSALYDHPTIIPGDPIGYESVKKINDHTHRLEFILLPGSNWVQIFPWMKHLPSRIAKWKRLGEYWFDRDTEMFQGLLGKVRDDVLNGVDNDTIGATFVRQQGRNGLSDIEIAWLAGILFSAGADTTSISLSWWLFAILLYPDTQRRAQAELDAVVGRDRVPVFSDLPHLPYIRAMVKETLRWRPALPLGLPHATTEDDWYEGMFIPKGTICFANHKTCNQDAAVYGEDAGRFDPARHLDVDGMIKAVKEEGHVTFGFGRRICVGRHMTNDTLAIAMAVMLWAMTISRAKDEQRVDIPLKEDEFVNLDLVQRPVPFKCNIVPRFPEVLDMLAAERDRHN